MLKEVTKKQGQKTLKIFSKGTTDYIDTDKFNPDYSAEEISEKLIKIAKENFRRKGFAAVGTDM